MVVLLYGQVSIDNEKKMYMEVSLDDIRHFFGRKYLHGCKNKSHYLTKDVRI